MKLSLNWLKEFVDFDWSPAELAERLTMAGLEVESVEGRGGDYILEAEVTPNRPDLLGHLGVGREISALTRKPLRVPAPGPSIARNPTESAVRVVVEDTQGCPRYIGRLIGGVRVGSTPDGIRRRLEALGIRSVNNVVDITNYVLLELGHPLHGFDYDRLSGRMIVVRRSRKGERIVTIDGLDRALNEEILVIADTERPVAVAGIMGGLDTEISGSTRNVFLESAYFDPVRIRRGSRSLGLASESSTRFEKGMDPAGAGLAAARATELMVQHAGGALAVPETDIYPRRTIPVVIGLRRERVNAILGTNMPKPEISDILEGLGMVVQDGTKLQVSVPTFRPDLTREVDLIEEVARIHGYDRLGVSEPSLLQPYLDRTFCPGRKDPREKALEHVRGLLKGAGFSEAYTASFSNPEHLARIRPDLSRREIRLKNPLVAEFAALRTTLIANLVGVAALNIARMNSTLRLYELGRIYLATSAEALPEERLSLCALVGGEQGTTPGTSDAVAWFRSLKGIVEALGDGLGLAGIRVRGSSRPPFWPSRSAVIVVGEKEIGRMGQFDSGLFPEMEVGENLWVLELDLDDLLDQARDRRTFQPLPRYPFVDRDLALVVGATTPYESVEGAVYQAGGDLVERVALFDRYRGEQIPQGKQGLALRVRFRSRERTLTEEEVRAAQMRIIERLRTGLGAELRG